MTYAPGMTLTRGWARLARAGVLGGASLFLATAGHVLGGGTLPGAGLLALTAVGLGLLAVTLTARRLRFGVLLAALGVEQLLLHLAARAFPKKRPSGRRLQGQPGDVDERTGLRL